MSEIIIAPTTTAGSGAHRSYVDWAAIFAGAVLATAISLTTLGSGIGLSLASPFHGEGISSTTFAIAAGP